MEDTWTDDNTEFECPYCHEKMDLSDEPELIYTQERVRIDCGYCEKPIEIYGSMSWSWSLYKGSSE